MTKIEWKDKTKKEEDIKNKLIYCFYIFLKFISFIFYVQKLNNIKYIDF